MGQSHSSDRFRTHSVQNQPPPLEPYDAWTSDPVLRAHVQAGGGLSARSTLQAYGALVGGELGGLGTAANEHRPQLRAYDRYGHRIDRVEFHPAYHRLMEQAIAHGVHSLAWNDPQPGAHVARAGLSYLHHQADAGTSCPLTMTFAAAPLLRGQSTIAALWHERATSCSYDPRHVPAAEKDGVTLGMGMTEKQGGSDVRSNSTRATVEGDHYRLVGHKWFFSAPMSDAFLVLAQAPEGLTCFLLPRILEDGTANAIRILRLKDKLGDWSNASSEVEFEDALAWRVGEPGRGVATIIEMVALTRLDCALGSAAEIRQAFVRALHHVRHRSAFGKALIDQPLMRNVIADLALESEAATALAFRVARAIDAAPRDPHEAALARLATPVAKYWVCKRAPAVVNEAQECLGGAGYVEDSVLPRLYRQAPLNSIWEGAGNVQCLDVLRALARQRDALDAMFAEFERCRGAHMAFDRAVASLRTALDSSDRLELRARRITERIALVLTATVLLQSGSGAAETFCRTRLDSQHGITLGTLPRDAPVDALIDAAWAP
ncbi:MAG TPA: isovaleryl-CoA dehydrogenase [Xanthomonadaceae bacterium]|nr:isovaleryl-CoA dehydrogenase [Xanthomonadaceae bacterium]